MHRTADTSNAANASMLVENTPSAHLKQVPYARESTQLTQIKPPIHLPQVRADPIQRPRRPPDPVLLVALDEQMVVVEVLNDKVLLLVLDKQNLLHRDVAGFTRTSAGHARRRGTHQVRRTPLTAFISAQPISGAAARWDFCVRSQRRASRPRRSAPSR